MPKNSVTTYVS